MLSLVSSLVLVGSLGLGGDVSVSSPTPTPVANLNGKVVSVGDIHLCFGTPPADARCSVTLPVTPPAADTTTTTRGPARFSVLGATICLGEEAAECDLRLPFKRTASPARDAPRQGA